MAEAADGASQTKRDASGAALRGADPEHHEIIRPGSYRDEGSGWQKPEKLLGGQQEWQVDFKSSRSLSAEMITVESRGGKRLDSSLLKILIKSEEYS